MTMFYGNTTQNFRAYGDYSTSETATTMTITLKAGMQSVAWGFDVGYVDCTATVNGSSSTTYNNSFYSGTGATVNKQMASKSVTIDKTSSNQTINLAIKVYNHSGYHNGTSTGTATVTVPAIAYQIPNAPSSCAATYVSDTSASITWTNGATDTTHPRTATLIERSDDGGAWAQIASASGTAANYTDNGISANHRYQYRVRASNSKGTSAYSTDAGYIYTTPAAPASVTLDKTSATTVLIDITGAAPYTDGYGIEKTYDEGETWSLVASSASFPYSDTVSSGTVQYRVKAVKGTLESAWTLSPSLVTICPPLAPTIVTAPANPTAYGESVEITWTPNHPDGSAQDHAEVKITDPNSSSTTYTVAGTTTTYSFTPNAVGVWTAQVRTYGLDPSAGEWSQTISWGMYNPPSVVITSPATDGTNVVALPLNVSWTVTDGTGVSAQRIVIDGVLNRTLATSDRSVSLNASDVALENGQTYTIRLRVMGGSGLVTEQVRTFDVAWLAPAAPVLQLAEGDGQSATIYVVDTHYSESGEEVEASTPSMLEYLTVHGKSVQDGTPTPSTPVPIKCVESGNLSPFFSHDLSDVYNSSTNPTGYWGTVATSPYVTYIETGDGWLHCEANNTSGSAVQIGLYPMPDSNLSASTEYTLMAEFKNVTVGNPGSSTSFIYVSNGSDTRSQFYGSGYCAFNFFSTAPSSETEQWVISTRASGSPTRMLICYFYFYPNAVISCDVRISLYKGTYTNGYTPIGAININDSGTTTPIDLQGHALRSLPNGIEDTLTVDAAGNVTMVQALEETYTAATDGVTGTVGVDVLSSTGQIADSAQVIYKLATPQTISLGTISMPYVEDTLWVDAEVTPTMEANLRPADYAGQPPIQSVDVQRVNADGTAWTVATGLTEGGSCIDPLPPLGVPVTYRATSSAASGSTASRDFLKRFGGRSWVLNFGPAAQEYLMLSYNPSASYTLSQGGVGYHFADGGAGGGLPVWYGTSDRDIVGSLKSAAILSGTSDNLRELCDKYPVGWIRDPFGHRWRAHIKPTVEHGTSQVWTMSMDWDAVRFKEAWDG